MSRIAPFTSLLTPLLETLLPEIRLSVPKHLENRIAEFRKYQWYSIPVALLNEAVSKKLFTLDQHIPPMVLVIEE